MFARKTEKTKAQGDGGRSEFVDGHFQMALAGRVGLGKIAPADVDLNRWDDEIGQGERGVPRGPHFDELILTHAIAHVNVAGALFSDCRLPFDLASTRPVVVAHEKSRF